ncbi:MAG: TolC family protein [Flavobacteriales bacterium]|nr:TolC family protein [Flavobacteriales bacterium]MCB9364582.1 TolC family protein [Flavobacteriales bacterium]
MKQISVKIVAIIMVFTVTKTSAQTLQEMINTALANNYQINIVKNEAQIATNNNVIGNTGALPTVDLNGTYFNSFNNTKQEFADGSVREGSSAKNTNLNATAMANWTVFNGFSVYAKRSQLGYLEELGQLNSKFYIEQTVSDIVTAYHQLVYEKQLLNNYQQSLNISLFRLNLEKKRKAIGAGKAMDFGQALVDYQADSIRLIGQENTIKALQIEINNILNNQLEQPLQVSDEAFSFMAIPSKDSLLQNVDNANQQLAQQRLQELIAETELRMAKANRYPKIDLFAGYQYSKSTSAVGFFNSNQTYGPTVGVSISFNLYNGGATNRNIKNTKLYTENASLTKQQVNQQINADVLNFYNEYKSITTQITLAKSNVAEMTKVYQTAAAQLKKGAINGYDFRLTQLSLLNSELTLMQLQFALKAIEINLNRLSGRVLEVYL